MANKAFRVSGIRGLQDTCPLDVNAFGTTEMDRRWGVEPNARMAVLVVVPPEETPAESAAIFDGAETVRELGPVLEGFELGLRVRVVVGTVRP